jgi:N utilization substance protein B
VERHLLPQRRRRSREIALQLLYTLDLRPDELPASVLGTFPMDSEAPEVVRYAKELVFGVWSERVAIDTLIRTYIVNWRPERMVVVDRVAVRMALYEGSVAKTTPLAVAISEAVELAKVFGTEESGRFVNGVLGRIVRALEGLGADGDEGERKKRDEGVPEDTSHGE